MRHLKEHKIYKLRECFKKQLIRDPWLSQNENKNVKIYGIFP